MIVGGDDQPEALVPAAGRDEPGEQPARRRTSPSVNTHASRIVMRPLGSGRFGLFTASISKS